MLHEYDWFDEDIESIWDRHYAGQRIRRFENIERAIFRATPLISFGVALVAVTILEVAL